MARGFGKRVGRGAVPVVVAAVLLGGCGAASSDDQMAATTAAGQTTTQAPQDAKTGAKPASRARPTVKVGGSTYGRILFDGRGRALYLFTRDAGPGSRCYGACAAAWPPYYAKESLTAGKGTSQKLLGTTRRRGGRRQVTYAGHPLYYYVGDKKAGQVLCQNVVEFGGTWLVVSGRGSAVG